MDSELAAANSEYGSDISLPALSDYGSDIDLDDIQEDAALGDLLVKLVATVPKEAVSPSVEHDAQHVDAAAAPRRPPLAVQWDAIQSSPLATRNVSMEFEYDAPSRRAFSVPREEPPSQIRPTPESSPSADDTRTPLERFRTKPKKPLSVTDLVSPAWCELQYSYTLSKFGRKPRTQAMKTGSKIHQKLEDEVHTTVPVQTVSKEDRFGLKIFNTIQGLRCLRETGLTRELEVWGVIDGQVINGIIDELSYACPDPELEETLELSKTQKSGGTLPLGQLSIEQAFKKADSSILETQSRFAAPLPGDWEQQVYIADVKTRGVPSLPNGPSLRPTWMQLMLYRKLLESLSLNTVDAETIFARYGLAPRERFSDTFMSECGVISGDDGDLDPEIQRTLYGALLRDDIYAHPNLGSLWSCMINEFRITIPVISDILRAEFRFSKTGEVIGNELVEYDADTIDTYIREEMEWWKGDREAKGVEIEEAFKCRSCDFAEICTWRKTKIEEATEKSRLRKGGREKSAV